MVYKLGFSPTYENHTKVGLRIYVGLSVKHQVPKSLACGIHRDQQFWEAAAEWLRSMGLSMNVWRFVVTATLNPKPGSPLQPWELRISAWADEKQVQFCMAVSEN